MIEIIVIGMCIILNFFLARAEMAFVSIGRPQLRDLARSGNSEAQKILLLREKPERTLSVLQIGISLVGALGAAVGGAGAEELIQPILKVRFGIGDALAETLSIILIVLPISYLSIVIGELVPKTLALRDPLRNVLRVAKWLVFFDRILGPLVSILEWSTKNILNTFFRRVRIDPATSQNEPLEINQLSQTHRQYVLNLLNIEKKRVIDIILPWQQVVTANLNQPIAEVDAIFVASGHTRIPVLQNNSVVGILNSKEFITLQSSGEKDWGKIIRPPVQVRETDSLLKVLRIMQEKRCHLSIVTSSNTQVGIVTMEDVFEEIIGDIFDEDDDGALRRMLSAGSTFRTMGKSTSSPKP